MNYYSAEYYISNKHAFVFKNMICSKLTKKLKDPHKELLVTHQPQTLSALHQLCFKPIWENNNSNLNKFVPFDFWDWCWLSLKQGECSTHNGSYWNITAHHPHTAFEFGQLFQLKISHCFQVSLDIHDLVIFFFWDYGTITLEMFFTVNCSNFNMNLAPLNSYRCLHPKVKS